MTIVLTETSNSECVAAPSTTDLWLDADAVTAATGWTLKPEGFCKGDICVPTPADAENYVADGKVNVASFWRLMDRPAAASKDGDVWFLGEGATERNDALLSLEAPDFTLPDFSGKLHSLTDFRRQRVLLITWASW